MKGGLSFASFADFALFVIQTSEQQSPYSSGLSFGLTFVPLLRYRCS